MDLELSDDQRRARDTARRFARERLERVGVEADRTHRFPAEAIAELGKPACLASSSRVNMAARDSTR